MAPLRYAAKCDPFLSLDCATHPPPWHNPRKARDQLLLFGNHAAVDGGGGSGEIKGRRRLRTDSVRQKDTEFLGLENAQCKDSKGGNSSLLPGLATGIPTGNGEKLSSRHREPGQAIKFAVA